MILSYSSIRRWEQCHRKWAWDWLPLQSEEDSTAFLRGRATHAGLAAWYESGSADAAREAIFRTVDKAYGPDLWDVEAAEAQTVKDYCLSMFEGYLQAYPSEPWKVERVEVPFKTPLGDSCRTCGWFYPLSEQCPQTCPGCGNPVHLLIGVIDLIVRIPETGQLLVVEHKTVESGAAAFARRFTPSMQLKLYGYAAERCMGEKVPFGMGNVLAMLKNGCERGYPFARTSLLYLDEPIVEELLDLASEMNLCLTSGVFRRNMGACWAGGRSCRHFSRCHPYDTWRLEHTLHVRKEVT